MLKGIGKASKLLLLCEVFYLERLLPSHFFMHFKYWNDSELVLYTSHNIIYIVLFIHFEVEKVSKARFLVKIKCKQYNFHLLGEKPANFNRLGLNIIIFPAQ